MNYSQAHDKVAGQPDHEVVVIGAGFGGIGALYQLREAGFDTLLLEAGVGVGGTWHWNTYPGARSDTEAWYYAFSFAPETLTEYRWRERFPGQAEVNGYISFVADRLRLTPDIRLGTRVTSLVYDEIENSWTICTDSGRPITTRFVVTAVGGLSDPHLPDIPGIDSFRGDLVHSARWPMKDLELGGKRVGVVGTGASGVQLVESLAGQVGELFVFQRTPNYVLDRNNYVISDEQWEEIKRSYPQTWEKVQQHYFGFPTQLTNRTADAVGDEERQRIFEEQWAVGGFSFYLNTFDDIAFSEWANDQAADFIRRKIRSRVDDPVTAELLCPKNHPFAAKRPPIGQGYYETFNLPNVHLVDVSANPIGEITENGIRVADQEFELDVIVFATGFDALTGALTAIDVVGRDGLRLADVFGDSVRTHTGLATAGFPNLLYIYGPQTPFANLPPTLEKTAGWIARALVHMRENDLDYIEAEPPAEMAWKRELEEAVTSTILYKRPTKDTAWMMGSNIPGKPVEVQVYFGGFDKYLKKTTEIELTGYPGFGMKRVAP